MFSSNFTSEENFWSEQHDKKSLCLNKILKLVIFFEICRDNSQKSSKPIFHPAIFHTNTTVYLYENYRIKKVSDIFCLKQIRVHAISHVSARYPPIQDLSVYPRVLTLIGSLQVTAWFRENFDTLGKTTQETIVYTFSMFSIILATPG